MHDTPVKLSLSDTLNGIQDISYLFSAPIVLHEHSYNEYLPLVYWLTQQFSFSSIGLIKAVADNIVPLIGSIRSTPPSIIDIYFLADATGPLQRPELILEKMNSIHAGQSFTHEEDFLNIFSKMDFIYSSYGSFLEIMADHHSHKIPMNKQVCAIFGTAFLHECETKKLDQYLPHHHKIVFTFKNGLTLYFPQQEKYSLLDHIADSQTLQKQLEQFFFTLSRIWQNQHAQTQLNQVSRSTSPHDREIVQKLQIKLYEQNQTIHELKKTIAEKNSQLTQQNHLTVMNKTLLEELKAIESKIDSTTSAIDLNKQLITQNQTYLQKNHRFIHQLLLILGEYQGFDPSLQNNLSAILKIATKFKNYPVIGSYFSKLEIMGQSIEKTTFDLHQLQNDVLEETVALPHSEIENRLSPALPHTDITLPSVNDNNAPSQPIKNVLFISGEPHTPGTLYRCTRNAIACEMAGYTTQIIALADVNPDHIAWADCMIVWRAKFSGHVDIMIQLAHEKNIPVVYDADDIVFKPELARIDIIDGIRTIGSTEHQTENFFKDMRRTLIRADFGMATTPELAWHMSETTPPVQVMRNIYDENSLRLSRLAYRQKQLSSSDGLIRIGYTGGTRTHQRDFQAAVPALISVLKKRPETRLVLFREAENKRPILLMNEFPELEELQHQIEWRDTVLLNHLPLEFARFDISIAPLEEGNVFCNAKSEIKYTEAALAGVPSVVSPTGPYKRLIINGENGYVAHTTEEWETALLSLIDNPSLRKTMALNAFHTTLWNFSPQRQAKLFQSFIPTIDHDCNKTLSENAMELMISRGAYNSKALPVIPDSSILYSHDMLKDAEVSIVITSYNYAHCIIEALESVLQQTLPLIDLVVVDDGSSDGSVDLLVEWAQHHSNRFNRLQILQSKQNAGLGGARNIGIAATETPYIMQLDADNRLLPTACEEMLAALKANPLSAFAYPYIQPFGEKSILMGEKPQGMEPYHPLYLVRGNYIDAMAMITRWAWAAAGGYYVQRDAMGWEDYDMWCTLAEMGLHGVQVKSILAEYRVHHTSMTNSLTEQSTHKPKVVNYIENRHDWIHIIAREGLHRH